MGKKSSYTLEYKTRLLSDYHVSNLSTEAFCGRNGIKVSTLEYWLRKETEYSVAVNAAPPNRQNLIDVTSNEAEHCAKSFTCVSKDSLFAKSEKVGEERRHADDDGQGKQGVLGPLHLETSEEYRHWKL